MEALILFFVLFFPGVYTMGVYAATETPIPFSALNELARTLTYTLPAFALLWYIISDKKGFTALKREKPGKKDFLPFAAGFAGLVLIGTGISLLISLLSQNQGVTPPLKVEAPAGVIGWIIMVVSCLCTGYLEESYFRYYLLSKLEDSRPRAIMMVFFSTFLFSVCHIYEGPLGIINAALAGALLSTLFIRFRSLHGIAWAHGVYNIFVYVMGNII
jgi:membrane protease YdiL (CAAX protease family)